MPDGGKLTIETANVALSEDYARLNPGVLPGRYVMLGVSDTGCGMDAETQSRIFEPFFTTKGPDKGTGLGLSTVYGIVTQNNGHISVYSEVGQGTVFKVYFRRIDETLTGRNPNAAASEPPRGTETILVVEDGAEIRKLVRRTLENAGYTVLEASHGEEALRVCEGYTGPIHLLLTDVVMPQMSGRALTEQLTPRYPAMSVLYMSGYTNDAIIHHGVLGADIAFLQKPFTPDRLAATVRAVLDQAGK
jgi:CheY-like chemotaxis protein